MLLAAIGIHGLIASGVAERTRELGIRMALGATVGQTIRDAAVPGILMAIAGLVIGCGVAAGVSGLLRNLLWGVKANDPLTFTAVVVTLLVVAIVASIGPALRVRRLDPVAAAEIRIGSDPERVVLRGLHPTTQNPRGEVSGLTLSQLQGSDPSAHLARGQTPMSATPAIHFLRQHKVPFTEHPYRYEERGGTAVSARELGVDEHIVIKTLVMEDERKQPLIVLMHGDRDVSTKNLARQIGCKTVDAVRSRGGAEAHRLPGRRHLALRHAQDDAGLSRSDRSPISIGSTSTAGAAGF